MPLIASVLKINSNRDIILKLLSYSLLKLCVCAGGGVILPTLFIDFLLTDLENELTVTGRGGAGLGVGRVRECGTDMYTLLYLKWITNKDLLHSTGNSAQYYVTT